MHSTGNDIESNDILDFEDNCENLDVLMNADQDYWTDRFGNKKPTIDYALRMAGFTPAGFDFTTGGVLKNGDRNKCVFNQVDQTWYSWSGNLPYNVIAGSVPGEGWKVVNFKHARIVLSGVGCKEGSDNTETLNKLFQRFENTGVEIYVDKNFSISGEVKINKLLLAGPGKITGTGKLVGVVLNNAVPYNIVQVWNNIIVSKDRVTTTHDFDVVLDPLFGDDGDNNKVRTLQRALDIVSAKVKTDPSKNYTIALRSGRTEVDKKLILDPVLDGWGGPIADSFDKINLSFDEFEINLDTNNKYGVRLISYPGESPTVTPKTTWFFKGDGIDHYKNRTVVNNTFQKRFFKLFGSDGKERFCAASWDRDTHIVNRNQNKNISITNVDGEIKHGIKVDTQLLNLLRKASGDELSSIRVRLTHWFTSSWHLEKINLSGDNLTFKGYTTDRAYGDGWSYINADQFGAPFFIENLKYFINKDDEFSTTDTEVVLPNDDIAFFTTSHIDGNGLLDFGGIKNLTIDGSLLIKYVTTEPLKIASGTWGVKNNPGSALILGNSGKVDGVTFYGIESDGIKMSKVGCIVKNTDLSYIGGNGIVHVDGAHSSIVKNCRVQYPGVDQVGAFGIHVTGANIEISDNVVLDGGFSSFRFDSSNFITDKSYGDVMYGVIYNNIGIGVGMRNGRLSERYPTGDTGVLTINGRGPGTRYRIYSNVLGDCIGAGGSRAVFLDDGVNGTRIHHNVLFGAMDYSIDIRQVNNNSFNNQVYNNFLIGRARIYDISDGSMFSSNILFGVLDASPGVRNYDTVSPGIENNIHCQQDQSLVKTDVSTQILNTVLTPKTKPFVRKLSFMGN